MQYLKALYAPFSTFETAPCVPSYIALPSYKFNSFARGSFTVGTTGVGWVSFCPVNVLNTNSIGIPTATSGSVWYTDQNFLGNQIAYPPVTGVNNTTTSSTALSSFATNPPDSLFTRQYRLVGAGIRIRYAGNLLNSNGEVVCFREEGNGGILTGVDQFYMLAQQRTVRYTTQMTHDKWAEVTFFPDSSTLLGFNTIGQMNAICPFTLANLVCFIDGGFPSSTYQYEVSAWYEAIGSYWPSLTRSESDPASLGAVIGAAPLQVDKQQPGLLGKLVAKAIENLPSSDSVVNALGSFAGASARSYFRDSNSFSTISAPYEPPFSRRSSSLRIDDMD